MARDIAFEEFCKTALESALSKKEWLKPEEINAAVVEHICGYDLAIAIYRDESKPLGVGALELVSSDKEHGYARCNSIPCADEATALTLQRLCKEAKRVS